MTRDNPDCKKKLRNPRKDGNKADEGASSSNRSNSQQSNSSNGDVDTTKMTQVFNNETGIDEPDSTASWKKAAINNALETTMMQSSQTYDDNHDGKKLFSDRTSNVEYNNNSDPETDIITTKSTLYITNNKAEDDIDIIIDGGATSTVVGVLEYSKYCDDMGTKPSLQHLGSNNALLHAFGTPNNYSTPQPFVGCGITPIPLDIEENINIKFKVVDGQVPFIIVKDTLRLLDAIEAHQQNWIEINIDGDRRVRMQTKINRIDGHSRLVLSGSNMKHGIVLNMLNSNENMDNNKIIDWIDARTHFHPSSIKLLLQRSSLWKPQMSEYFGNIRANCRICLETGDPENARKFNLKKLHKNFNNRVHIDIAYWRKKLILYMVDYATSYSETASIASRSIDLIKKSMDRIWIHKHGDFDELYVDREFDKDVLKVPGDQREIKLCPVPSRRHNKTGTVEIKNRVLKDILEKLIGNSIKTDNNFNNTLIRETFLSTIMYGNKNVSSFEMVRGYTPSIIGTRKGIVPESVIEAAKVLQARRMLKRVLKSKPRSYMDRDVKVGDPILVLVPGRNRKRGQWKEDVVSERRSDRSVACGNGHNKRVIAAEDFRLLPKNNLTKSTFKHTYDIDSMDTDDPNTNEESQPNSPSYNKIHKPSSLPTNINNVSENRSIHEPATAVRKSSRVSRKPSRYGLLKGSLIDNTSNIEQEFISQLYVRTNGGQIMVYEYPDIPAFITEQARNDEIKSSWQPHMKIVKRRDIPLNSNVIGSHFVYKVIIDSVQGDNKRNLKMKVRLRVHGHQDDERQSIRSDAAVVFHYGFRIFYSMSSIYGLKLAKIDIKGAFPRSGEAKRMVYLRPPNELSMQHAMFLLTSTIY